MGLNMGPNGSQSGPEKAPNVSPNDSKRSQMNPSNARQILCFGHYSQINDVKLDYLLSVQNQLIYLYRYWLFKDDCKKYKNLGWKAFSFFNTFRQNVFANSKIYIIFRPVCSDGLGRTLLPTQPLLPTSHFGLCKRTKPGGMEMKETQLKIEWEAPELAIVHYCK